MKFIIVILPILISLSLFASLRDEKCEKIINSKKAPSWIKNTAKLVKVNGNYYFEAVGKSKKAHNLEFSVYASSDLAKRGIIKVMRKYFKIIEDYTSSAILKYDYHKINKVFKTKIKIIILKSYKTTLGCYKLKVVIKL